MGGTERHDAPDAALSAKWGNGAKASFMHAAGPEWSVPVRKVERSSGKQETGIAVCSGQAVGRRAAATLSRQRKLARAEEPRRALRTQDVGHGETQIAGSHDPSVAPERSSG